MFTSMRLVIGYDDEIAISSFLLKRPSCLTFLIFDCRRNEFNFIRFRSVHSVNLPNIFTGLVINVHPTTCELATVGYVSGFLMCVEIDYFVMMVN
jgi:hypothetical protein